MIRIQTEHAQPFIAPEILPMIEPRVERANKTLIDRSGVGAEFLGWLDLALKPDGQLIAAIADVAERIRTQADVLVCIGIGGSYLGADAMIQASRPYFGGGGPEIIFAGHHMSGRYHEELLAYLHGKSVFVNVISKSGTTLEPALAFRFIRSFMEENFDDADQRIIATTDAKRGALFQLATEKGYTRFVIPDNVGGRFSVITPVGLLPLAVAGIDIATFVSGFTSAATAHHEGTSVTAHQYAALRWGLLASGYSTELLATFEPRLTRIGAWWQQLFGESEGKEGKGILPVSVQYSTDLHSLGQYVQQGQRNLMETFLIVEEDLGSLTVTHQAEDLDGLNYLADTPMSHINRQAYLGTLQAHRDGGVPTMTITLPDLRPPSLGALLYMFEHAVAVGGYMLDVNPFDQPGVEDYKREMFRLLGKTA